MCCCFLTFLHKCIWWEVLDFSQNLCKNQYCTEWWITIWKVWATLGYSGMPAFGRPWCNVSQASSCFRHIEADFFCFEPSVLHLYQKLGKQRTFLDITWPIWALFKSRWNVNVLSLCFSGSSWLKIDKVCSENLCCMVLTV